MADLAKNEVPLPPSDVWELLTDVAKWQRWMPRVKDLAHSSDAGELKEGARIELLPQALLPRSYHLVVERLEPPHVLVLRRDFSRLSQLTGLLFGAAMKSTAWTWRIEASGSSGSKVTVEADLRPTMLGRIFGGWLQRIMENMFKFNSRPLQKAFVKYARTFPQGA